MKKIYLLFTLFFVLTACGKTEITGSWVQPIPGQESSMQGFKLEKDGKASSINMYTLVYENWEKQGKYLILSGQSVGNKQTLAFTDTFEIEKLTPDNLVLKRGEYSASYIRE